MRSREAASNSDPGKVHVRVGGIGRSRMRTSLHDELGRTTGDQLSEYSREESGDSFESALQVVGSSMVQGMDERSDRVVATIEFLKAGAQLLALVRKHQILFERFLVNLTQLAEAGICRLQTLHKRCQRHMGELVMLGGSRSEFPQFALGLRFALLEMRMTCDVDL